MRNLYVPDLKDELVLAQDWTFTLQEEHRNKTLITLIDPTYAGRYYPEYVPSVDPRTGRHYGRYMPKLWTAILPAGTKLLVERVYLRKGQEGFGSLTFTSVYQGKKIRFWAKLADVNTMVIE